MKRLTDRRRILIAAGSMVAAVVAVAGSMAAQPAEISGTIALSDGKAIPKGQIEIYLEDRAAAADNARGRAAAISLVSDGDSKAIRFSFAAPANFTGAPTQQIVAQLEREDGWLLARGSGQSEDGKPVEIVLFTVMY